MTINYNQTFYFHVSLVIQPPFGNWFGSEMNLAARARINLNCWSNIMCTDDTKKMKTFFILNVNGGDTRHDTIVSSRGRVAQIHSVPISWRQDAATCSLSVRSLPLDLSHSNSSPTRSAWRFVVVVHACSPLFIAFAGILVILLVILLFRRLILVAAHSLRNSRSVTLNLQSVPFDKHHFRSMLFIFLSSSRRCSSSSISIKSRLCPSWSQLISLLDDFFKFISMSFPHFRSSRFFLSFCRWQRPALVARVALLFANVSCHNIYILLFVRSFVPSSSLFATFHLSTLRFAFKFNFLLASSSSSFFFSSFLLILLRHRRLRILFAACSYFCPQSSYCLHFSSLFIFFFFFHTQMPAYFDAHTLSFFWIQFIFFTFFFFISLVCEYFNFTL